MQTFSLLWVAGNLTRDSNSPIVGDLGILGVIGITWRPIMNLSL